MRKIFLIIVSAFLLSSCASKQEKKTFIEYKGFALGNPFMIEYDQTAGDLNAEIGKLFKAIEKAVWLKDSSSFLSRFNAKDSTGTVNQHFINLVDLSRKVYESTGGAFDPTIYPLVDFWKEDPKKFYYPEKVDSSSIDSLLKFVGYGKFYHKGISFLPGPEVILNFDQIYDGYMVDKVAELFNSYNISNYRIEVAGKIRAKGMNVDGKKWMLGIDQPTDNLKSRKLLAITTLDDNAFATSGTYRKYFSKGEMRLPYTIDPITGYPVHHTLISVSVFASTCAEADAYSSAFMVMGPEKTKIFLNAHPEIQAYLISTNYKGEWITFISSGLKAELEIVKGENPI